MKADEIYIVQVPPPEPATPRAQKMPLHIVYEDKDLLVINKPVGMVVHPAPGNREHTLVNALLAHCGKSLSGIGGVARPGVVHRLDKDTSGLMVVAKNDAAHQTLSKQFADRSLSRTYHALVWGEPLRRWQGEIEGSIGRHPRDRKKMAVTAKGKPALTHYRVVESYEIASLVECKLATGRTHQIRVHLAHHKHPVIGDPVYGKKEQRSPGSGKKIIGLYAGLSAPGAACGRAAIQAPAHGQTHAIQIGNAEGYDEIAGEIAASLIIGVPRKATFPTY